MKNKNRYRILIMLLSLLLITLVGCKQITAKNTDPISKTSFLLNTINTITIYDSKDQSLLDGAFDLIADYELIYSRTLEPSELYQLNHGLLPKSNGGYVVSDELKDILEYGLEYGAVSKGNFDITIAPISSMWDFTEDVPLPEKEQIQAELPKVDYKSISIQGNVVTFVVEGVSIDLGGIAKGNIADKVKEYLLSKGVKSALINLGGNILSVGQKPDGTPFKIGIQKPFADKNEVAAVMDINDYSIVSSGIYERYRYVDDVLYHHILDPNTGYPYVNNLVALTIVSKKSVDGDGLSTTCFALGLEEGLKLINSLEDIYAVFITDDYQLHYSEGFEDKFNVKKQQ